jgi:hypothetical protein
MEALQRESEGGTLHGFTTGIFAQIVEMERRTCTLRVVERNSGEKGALFFKDGVLIDARLDGVTGNEAAHTLLSWEEVSLSIQNTCAARDKKIRGDLKGILIETLRKKDKSKSKNK